MWSLALLACSYWREKAEARPRLQRWIAVALGGLIFIGPIGTWLIDPKVRTLGALAHTLPDGPVPATLAARTHDGVLRIALHTTTALLFGIIFLMTIKPLLTSAIGAMLIAACLGVASALPFVRARGAGTSERSNQHEGDSA